MSTVFHETFAVPDPDECIGSERLLFNVAAAVTELNEVDATAVVVSDSLCVSKLFFGWLRSHRARWRARWSTTC
jgi:hypothetical protein